jgi:hypothetical protein
MNLKAARGSPPGERVRGGQTLWHRKGKRMKNVGIVHINNTDKVTTDPSEHNYMKKLLHILETMDLPPTVTHILIRHDSWCGAYRGEACNCDPDIVFPGNN